MVEVFKTNVNERVVAQQVMDEIKAFPLDLEVSFDLEDCDRILRVCGSFDPEALKQQIVALFHAKGYWAVPLDEGIDVAINLDTFPWENQAGIVAFLGIR